MTQPPLVISKQNRRRLEAHIHKHFARRTQISELAAVAGVSPSSFTASFARTFGVPPHKYIINLRLDFAQRLLVRGELTLPDIAEIAGFSDQSHLASTLKNYRGKNDDGNSR
jgi:AraC family transcriptional regulator